MELEEEAAKLQKASDENGLREIWDYRGKLRNPLKSHNVEMGKKDRAEGRGMGEAIRRWGEWAAESPIKEKRNETKDRTYT